MLKRYTKLARASKEIVRTDIPRKLLHAFVDLADKVKGKPIKSVGFELSDQFNPNDPDFDYVHAAVRAALDPPRRTASSGPTTQGTPGATASPSGDPTEKVPSQASKADDDCAYHPVTTTN
jgi:hypothetical protein